MEEEPARTLAVILHADVVGSTALVQANETVAHQRILGTFQRFSEVIENQGGTAHEVRGDALVAEFSRASDAVEAALSFQDDNTGYLEEISDEIKPVVRVGIALGEVVVADNTVTGEAVVLAQRLEQLADPGGVCIQGSAKDTVPRRLAYSYQAAEVHELKGFSDPVLAFRITRTEDATETKSSEAVRTELDALKLPDKPSIAVLPFTNMSGDSEQEYFSDGLTEDIITALSQISGLFVVARNSTMIYKGQAVDIKTVGREQGVRHVLEGSVRVSGDRLRITAQLIDATTGNHEWAEKYDRKLDDIFAIQDEIARGVTVEMQVRLTQGEQARMWAGGTNNLDAWRKCITAATTMASHVKEDVFKAKRLLEEALALDPQYVDAWAWLGRVFWGMASYNWGEESPEATLLQGEEAARTALSINPDDPGALATLGVIHLARKEADKAISVTNRAVDLAPSHAGSAAYSAIALTFGGQPKKGLSLIKRAMRLSPVYPMWYQMIVGVALHLLGEHEEAIDVFEKCITMEPGSQLPRIWITSALIEVGKIADATRYAEEVLEIEPNFSTATWVNIYIADDQLTNLLLTNLQRAGLPA